MNDPFNISVNWKEKVQFTATNNKTDSEVAIDLPESEFGGEKKGTTPKHLFLQGVAGCTAQIVIMFLGKMKAVMPVKFRVDISGKLNSQNPLYFEHIDLTYYVEGNTEVDTLKKVIKMSEEQYCGLTFMVSKLAKINYKLILNGEEIEI